MKKLCLISALLLLLTACGQVEQPPASSQGQVASSGQMAPVEDVVDPDTHSIYYDVPFASFCFFPPSIPRFSAAEVVFTLCESIIA